MINFAKLESLSSIKKELKAKDWILLGANSLIDNINNVKKERVIIKFIDFFWKNEPTINKLIATRAKINSGAIIVKFLYKSATLVTPC